MSRRCIINATSDRCGSAAPRAGGRVSSCRLCGAHNSAMAGALTAVSIGSTIARPRLSGSNRRVRPPRRRRGGCLARRAATQSTACEIAAVVKESPVRQLAASAATPYQRRGACRGRPLLLDRWASGEWGQPSHELAQSSVELAVPRRGAPVPRRPRRAPCDGRAQKSGPAFAPRLLSHARIDRPARVICPPPWPVVARARVTPLMVDQPNSIPVPEGA